MTAGFVFLSFGLQAQEEEAADPSMELIDAVREGQVRDVTRLLAAGADANTKTDGGMPLLSIAAMKGPAAVADALGKAGADVNAKDNLGWTPLIRAAVGGNAEATTALLAAGADKNATDFFERTALQVAEGRGHADVIAALQGSSPS